MNISGLFKTSKIMMLSLSLGLMSHMSFAQLPPNTYCGTVGTPPNPGTGCNNTISSNSMINSVVTKNGIVNINNQNTGCGVSGNNASYTDYTTSVMQVTQDAGKSIDLEISLKGGSDAIRSQVMVYVDWDRDGAFTGLDEYIAPFGWTGNMPHPHNFVLSNGGKAVIKINVPGHAKEGKTRMRIITGSLFMSAQTYGNMSECTNNNAGGEAEDYVFEVINPCLPPNVISIASLGDNEGEFAWTKKPNAEFYEYVIQRDATPPPSLGYNYTTDTKVKIDTFQCDTKYYIFVRAICDDKGTAAIWKRSDWKIDSFTTHACCEAPVVTVDKIDGASGTARISWPPVFSSIGYDYVITTAQTLPNSGYVSTTSNVVILRGLDFNKRYYVFVRSRCNPTPLSGWTDVNFKSGKTTSVSDLDNIKAFSINAYPNPMLDNVVVKLNGEIGNNASLVMVDLTGKVIYNTPVNSSEVKLNTTSLSSGIYILKYSDDTHNEVIKVNKN